MNHPSALLLILCLTSSTLLGQAPYDITDHWDLSYMHNSSIEEDSLQQLNLVIPMDCTSYPLLIWIGGGAWSYGEKDQEMDLARKLAKTGMAVASVGHRLSPAIWRDSLLHTGIQHPEHIRDIAAAVKWLVDHTDMYGYDSEDIFIGGYSSGAHLAALISLDSVYMNEVGLSPRLFKGVIPISGTYDLIDYHSVFLNGSRPELAKLHVEAVFGETEEHLRLASPTNYLSSLSSPLLIMSDNSLYNYTRLFEDRIRQTPFRQVQVVYAYGLSHGELWKNLSFEEDSPYRQIIAQFILNRYP